VVRHFLPYGLTKMYDRMGMFGLLILLMVGGRMISLILMPALNAFNAALVAL
jgi:hypothetical protein